MKTYRAAWVVAILATLIAGECRANPNGSDDFNDNAIDAVRWGADIIVNSGGALTEINQHLEYSATGIGAQATTFHPWVLNTGSYSQDWDVRVDVRVPPFNLTNGQAVYTGLLIGNGGFSPPTNYVFLEFGQSSSRKFKRSLSSKGVKLPNVETPTAVTNSAVRIAYDAAAKTLSCYYDENGSDCGYEWTLLQTDEVGVAWGMNAGSVFNIGIIADSSLIALASTNQVGFDNYSTSSGTLPSPAITLRNGQAIISWPTNAPVCHLESASALLPPVCWQITANAPGIVNTNYAITNAITGSRTFYRLSR